MQALPRSNMQSVWSPLKPCNLQLPCIRFSHVQEGDQTLGMREAGKQVHEQALENLLVGTQVISASPFPVQSRNWDRVKAIGQPEHGARGLSYQLFETLICNVITV